MTAACKGGLSALLLHFSLSLQTVRLPRFVMRQDVAFRLLIQNVNVVVSKIDWLNPIARGINDYQGGSSCCAARDQHRRQAYG